MGVDTVLLALVLVSVINTVTLTIRPWFRVHRRIDMLSAQIDAQGELLRSLVQRIDNQKDR